MTESTRDRNAEEIVKTLLSEINEDITDEQVSKVLDYCCGDPWKATKVYYMVRENL